jgi:hypothetical protein
MPNFQNLVLQNIKLPKVFRKWIDSFELVSLCCISGSSFVGSTKSLLKDDGSPGTITPVSVLSISLTQWFSKKIPKTE